jgi:glycosyltransferase involved in cell wall biosynthesis
MRELVTPGETGWLVPPDDPEAMAARIVDLLDRPRDAQRAGAAAATRMREDFSIEAMVARYDELFQDLIRRKAAGARP